MSESLTSAQVSKRFLIDVGIFAILLLDYRLGFYKMSFCSDRVAIFGEKNHSAEDETDGNFYSFHRNSVCFAE
jgi:hypothetical protein